MILPVAGEEQRFETPFGAEMRRRRRLRRRGYSSPEYLAERVGRSRSWWLNLERGWETVGGAKRPVTPSPDNVALVARALGWDVLDAFACAGLNPADYPELVVPARSTARLTDEDLLNEMQRLLDEMRLRMGRTEDAEPITAVYRRPGLRSNGEQGRSSNG